MQSINLHLKILIAVLVSLGVLITGYQIYFLDIPVTEDETGFVFGYGDIKEVDLVAGDEYAKADQHGDQDLQVQIY